jgi:ribosomal protein S27AE
MALRSDSCPKCGGRQVQGFILDHADGQPKKVTSWVEGAPEKGWFGGVKIRGKRTLEIESWRCDKCGFLESYAPVP